MSLCLLPNLCTRTPLAFLSSCQCISSCYIFLQPKGPEKLFPFLSDGFIIPNLNGRCNFKFKPLFLTYRYIIHVY